MHAITSKPTPARRPKGPPCSSRPLPTQTRPVIPTGNVGSPEVVLARPTAVVTSSHAHGRVSVPTHTVQLRRRSAKTQPSSREVAAGNVPGRHQQHAHPSQPRVQARQPKIDTQGLTGLSSHQVVLSDLSSSDGESAPARTVAAPPIADPAGPAQLLNNNASASPSCSAPSKQPHDMYVFSKLDAPPPAAPTGSPSHAAPAAAVSTTSMPAAAHISQALTTSRSLVRSGTLLSTLGLLLALLGVLLAHPTATSLLTLAPSLSHLRTGLGGSGPSTHHPLGSSSALQATATPAATGPPPPPDPLDPQPGRQYDWNPGSSLRVITVVSEGQSSPYRTTWDAVVDHTVKRLAWTDPTYQMMVFTDVQLAADPGMRQRFTSALQQCQLLVGVDVRSPQAVDYLLSPGLQSQLPGVRLYLGGEARLEAATSLRGFQPLQANSVRTSLAKHLSFTPDGQALNVHTLARDLWSRHSSEDFLFIYLVLANQYVATVPAVADTTKGFDLGSLVCMAQHCGSKVLDCVRDTTCKAALDCLQACSFNDQVCQYRCIVSHESPKLEQFSLCILQLHNCRNLNAKPPLMPNPQPMPTFRGQALSHEAAEDLFIGWLQPGQGVAAGQFLEPGKGLPHSWLVAAGKNPAYDYFPCQHQIYYRGKGKGVLWYEPVFKAITLDGRQVWRRRRYRVRRGQSPGTFFLSVLDNGVTSNEFWRIMDCADDLAFCLFYYSGAAATAGLSYSGAVLATPDGRMPGPQHTERLQDALRRSGIELWELSYVDNSACMGAPLQITGPVAGSGQA